MQTLTKSGHHGARRRRCRGHRRSAPRIVQRQCAAPKHVRLRLCDARLHDHHPHGLQSRADERRAAVHPGGPAAERRRDRGADGIDERVHAGVHPRRRLDGRRAGPPRHDRAGERIPHGRRARHVARRQLRRALGRALRHQHRRRVRPRRRARVQRRDLAGVDSRRLDLVARHVRQRRHPAQLRVELRLGRPAGAPRLARHVRHRGGSTRIPRRGRAHHAGVATLARHARSPRRRAHRARTHLRLCRGGRPPRRGDQARRRGAARFWQRRVAGSDLSAVVHGMAHPCLRHRVTVLPASVRHRRHRAVQSTGVQEGRHGVGHRRPGNHGRRRGRQDVLHPRSHALLRPPRPPPAPAGQHRRHDLHPDLACSDALRRVTFNGECRGVRRVRDGVRRGVLRRARADDGDVHRGGHAAAAARAGHGPRRSGEPAGMWCSDHDVHIARRRDHHGRVLLPLRRCGGDGVRVRVRVAPGDEGEKLGEHGHGFLRVIETSSCFIHQNFETI